MTITITAETPRPLIDVPLGVTVEQGKPPVLGLAMCQEYAVEDVAVEYVARFFGNVTKDVVISGGTISVLE
jgi:hypothetical protein